MGSELFEYRNSYIWKINNLNMLKHSLYCTLKSPGFKAFRLPESTWRIYFSPIGNVASKNGFTSMFLIIRRNGNAGVYCSFSIEVLNVDGSSFQSMSSHHFFSNFSNDKGWDSYIEFDKITNLAMQTSDDTVVFRCKLYNRRTLPYKMPTVLTNTTLGFSRVYLKFFIKDINSFTYEFRSFALPKMYKMVLQKYCNKIRIVIRKCFKQEVIIPITLRVILFCKDSYECHTETRQIAFQPRTYFCALQEIIPEVILKYDENGSLKNATFTIVCMFATYNNKFSDVNEVVNIQSSSFRGFHNSSTRFSLSGIRKMLFNLYNSERDCDVILQSADWKIPAHRIILLARSPRLSRILKEYPNQPIRICNVDYFLMKMFMKFLYVGVVEELNYETAIKLSLLADEFEIRSLKCKCSNFLKRIESEIVNL